MYAYITGQIVATRPDFWTLKLDGNRERDRCMQIELQELGWEMLVVWECQTRDLESLEQRLDCFLS